jgi:hypothetical protein
MVCWLGNSALSAPATALDLDRHVVTLQSPGLHPEQ